ncbi:unnamed protein product [Schistosoma curassoni]|uniref:Ovule protein n=1 Tax=Schistosoma curassoni TaxID=6186 RepID=A0A183KBF0_9TREM|nr:unnamed protein product [Schistosoma curassoni]
MNDLTFYFFLFVPLFVYYYYYYCSVLFFLYRRYRIFFIFEQKCFPLFFSFKFLDDSLSFMLSTFPILICLVKQ